MINKFIVWTNKFLLKYFLDIEVLQQMLDQHKIKKNLLQVLIKKDSFLMEESKVLNLQGKKENIAIGSNSYIRGELFIFAHGGKIEIGDFCYVGEQSKIWSANSIIIGNRVLISHNVNIHDNNAHSIISENRHEHYKQIITSGHPIDKCFDDAPVIIEDDVWIGFNSTILKGVRIGKGSIIAANSVITKDVHEFTVVAGNPQKVIKKTT